MSLTRNDLDNLVLLKGNLTKEPEFRQAANGAKLAKFRIAVNRRWKDRQSGEEKSKATFINVDIWGPIAEYVRQYKTGDYVQVAGELCSEEWEKDGQRQYRTYVLAKTIENFTRKAEGREDITTEGEEIAEEAVA